MSDGKEVRRGGGGVDIKTQCPIPCNNNQLIGGITDEIHENPNGG